MLILINPELFVPRMCPNKGGRISQVSPLSILLCTDLGTYLSVPLVQGRAKKSVFFGVLEKIQWHMASWKGQLLNRMGAYVLGQIRLGFPSYLFHANLMVSYGCLRED